jgi:hypothetical protein
MTKLGTSTVAFAGAQLTRITDALVVNVPGLLTLNLTENLKQYPV